MTSIYSAAFLVLWLLSLPSFTIAFYIPGLAPQDYHEGDPVPLLVNTLQPLDALDSSGALVSSLLNYEFYDSRLHFCRDNTVKQISENLGSILFGDRIMTSVIRINMNQNLTCQKICTSEIPEKDQPFLANLIRQRYGYNWLVDGLPIVDENLLSGGDFSNDTLNTVNAQYGFPIGSTSDLYSPGKEELKDSAKLFLSTFFDITIFIHKRPTEPVTYRVVGARVSATPRDRFSGDECPPISGSPNYDTTLKKSMTFDYGYSVKFIESDQVWATRWDPYLNVPYSHVHWLSLFYSVLIVCLLVVLVGATLVRALRKDITRYNAEDIDHDDVQEDSGWKLVHGDVFRPPRMTMLLSVLLGNGVQFAIMSGITLVFAVFGFLNPSNRGSLTTAILFTYYFLSFTGGYVSARAYAAFGGQAWKMNLVLTPSLLPGIIFATLILINFFVIAAKSSGAIPFSTMLAIILLWVIIALPLSFVGGFLALKAPKIKFAVRSNQIPRQVPEQPLYLKAIPNIFLSGVLPFGAIFVQLYFIMNSIWFGQVYYMFGFLFVCFGMMIMTCASITILMVYFQLCSENYHWWWRSFFVSGSCAFYVFLYSIILYTSRMQFANLTSTVMYLTYSVMISFLLFVMTGSLGFIASFMFLQKIYTSIKID